jgi:DNA-binding response OmpR family regulator
MINILMIENDIENAKMVEQNFGRSKYQIFRMTHADATFEKLKNPSYHLIIVDMDQNTSDCLNLISQLRQANVLTPVLVLSLQSGVEELMPHLVSNEFDFLLKPVTMIELKARAKALLKKNSSLLEKFHLKSAGVILDLISRQAYRDEQAIALQNNEFELLEFLMRNAGRIITKTEILEKVWNYSFDPQTNIVDVLVWRLRSKIDRHFSSKLIQTVRGVGYTFRPIEN